MKLSLYNIQNEYLQLVETLIENGGELTPELENEIVINKEQLQNKGTCYGLIIKQLEAEIDVIELNAERFTKMVKSRKNTIERLKTNISTAMQLYEMEKLKTPLIEICFSKSESVEVENVKLLDPKYVTIKVTETPDKVNIKKALKSGETVTGAILKQNSNLQIK